MMTIDVISLYPNIPVPDALEIANNLLFESELSDTKADILFKAMKLCMKQNEFMYDGKWYKQTFGVNMGNPLSCFVANILMGNLEQKLKDEGKLPKLWLRFVDDIFIIIKKENITSFLKMINEIHKTIKFTEEIETDKQISFLDLTLTRKGNKIDVSVYRKSTNTDRFITRDSFCPKSTKMATFHSMVHRMCRLPLSINNYMKELGEIKRIASVNGYTEEEIMKLVEKHSKNIKKNNNSTFFKQQKQKIKRLPFSFNPSITNYIKPHFRKLGHNLAFSNNNKIANLLGNTKDKPEKLKLPGIYKVICPHCLRVYVGQSKRHVEKRFSEHLTCIKYNRTNKSAVALHVWKNDPPHTNITKQCLDLVKHVRKRVQLDAWESLYMKKYQNGLMNVDPSPIISPLFNFTK